MRIAYVISTLERCGPVNVLYEIVKGLIDECDVAVYTLAPEGNNTRIHEFEALDVHVTCVFNSRLESMLRGRNRLESELNRFRPDVVHAHGYRAYILCAGLSCARIATVHNCIYEDFATSYSRVKAWVMTRTEVAALKRFDLIVACAESNAEYLRRQYGLAVVPIRNGVDQSAHYALDDAERAGLRIELGFSERKMILISTGGCSKRKGTLPLIKCFHAANKEIDAAELHIFGKGPAFEQCMELEYHDVILHGFVSDATPYLQASDVFISLSQSEGMPLAVLEAICCGLPAVLSDIPPHREIYNAVKMQDCIKLVELHNHSDVVKTMVDILGETKHLLDRPRDVSCFGSNLMARKYKEKYDSILLERHR